MDLSKLSNEDLLALKSGDLSKVSTAGLMALRGQSAPAPKEPIKPEPFELEAQRTAMGYRELMRSPPMALARGVKDVLDTGAEGLAYLYDKATGGGAPTLSGLVTGQQPQGELARVRAMNKAGKEDFEAATQGAALPQVARVAGNLAATVPAVNAIGGAVGTVAPKLGAAITSGGMATGAAPVGAVARAADMGTRIAGGALGGAAGAAMVNPDDATMGAVLGGAAPVVVRGMAAAGQGVGRMLRGPEQTPQMAQALQSAQELGLVVPPTQARASLGNRLMEGVAGKITTAQNASAQNAPKINEAAAKALGLQTDQLTPEGIGYVKKAAGVLYDAVGSAGEVKPGPEFTKALDDIVAPHLQAAKGFPNAKPSPVIGMIDSLRSESFDAAAAVAKIKELRSAADDAFKPGGAGADIGRAAKKASKALEDALEAHLTAIGEPDLLRQFKDARTLYAKASTVGEAINPASNNVDARKLAQRLAKGKPLSGELKQVAEFAAQFPKAAQPVEAMGSLPQLSPLDWFAGGGLGMATGNPLSLLMVGARPAARAAALSGPVQNRLIQGAPMNALPAYEALMLGARAAPTISADR